VPWLILEGIMIAIAVDAISGRSKSIFIDGFFLAASILLFVIPAVWWLRQHRPIVVDETGIASVLLGRRFVVIPWTSIKGITKIH